MSTRTSLIRATATSIALLACAAAACGEEIAPPAPLELPAHSDVLDADTLGDMRGGEELPTSIGIAQTTQNADATLTNNRIDAQVIDTGKVTFEPNAITNFNGIGLFNTVTGANNAVNAVIGVTINLH